MRRRARWLWISENVLVAYPNIDLVIVDVHRDGIESFLPGIEGNSPFYSVESVDFVGCACVQLSIVDFERKYPVVMLKDFGPAASVKRARSMNLGFIKAKCSILSYSDGIDTTRDSCL